MALCNVKEVIYSVPTHNYHLTLHFLAPFSSLFWLYGLHLEWLASLSQSYFQSQKAAAVFSENALINPHYSTFPAPNRRQKKLETSW